MGNICPANKGEGVGNHYKSRDHVYKLGNNHHSSSSSSNNHKNNGINGNNLHSSSQSSNGGILERGGGGYNLSNGNYLLKYYLFDHFY